MKSLGRLIGVVALAAGAAAAQPAPEPPGPLNDSAKGVLGIWEFSNAARDKICTAVFKSDTTAVGYKVEFDPNCASLFPLVADVAGWKYPEHDLLYLLNAQGKALVEFSEAENNSFEAPTPGVGVLFLKSPSAAAAEPAAKTPQQVAGDWTLKRGNGAAVCQFTLAAAAAGDGNALTVRPGCDAGIVQLGFTQWQLDRGELVLLPARGNPWRFESIDDKSWALLPESADQTMLVRQ